MRLAHGSSMVECLVALAIINVGLLGMAELKLHRLQQIRLIRGFTEQIGAAHDAAVSLNAGAAAATGDRPSEYTAVVETDAQTQMSRVVVRAGSGSGVAIALPIHSSAAP